MWIEIRGFYIFGKKTQRRIHRIKNHLNLDQNSQRTHQINMREISKIKIQEKSKLKLNLTQIMIRK